MVDQHGSEHWYALKVFYNRVFPVNDALHGAGVETYLPMKRKVTERDGRRVERLEPVISSLLFVRMEERALLDLQQTLALRYPLMPYFDRETRKPAPIADREMAFFMLVSSSGDEGLEYFHEEDTTYRKGDRVRVTGGPFKGAEGYIRRIRGDRRLVVAIEGVVAVATTHIPNCLLEPVPPTRNESDER